MSAIDVAAEILAENPSSGFYRMSDKRRTTDQIREVAQALIDAEAKCSILEGERDRERKAWAGIERKASNLRHRLDALQDAARNQFHGDHFYDFDVLRTDCALCAAIEGRYQPPWMEEPHEWVRDPIFRLESAQAGEGEA